MKVYWSYNAKARLLEIHAYIAQDAPVNADRMREPLLQRGDRLALQPRADRRVD